jgi:hypothetical protein
VSDPAGVLVSVRGEARQMVPPDSALVAATIASSRGSKAEAVRAAAAALDSLTADLAARGGVALDADTGLLGDSNPQSGFTARHAMARAASGGGGEPDAPLLDPVPQELAAVVEARFSADGVSLTAH